MPPHAEIAHGTPRDQHQHGVNTNSSRRPALSVIDSLPCDFFLLSGIAQSSFFVRSAPMEFGFRRSFLALDHHLFDRAWGLNFSVGYASMKVGFCCRVSSVESTTLLPSHPGRRLRRLVDSGWLSGCVRRLFPLPFLRLQNCSRRVKSHDIVASNLRRNRFEPPSIFGLFKGPTRGHRW